MSAKFFFLLQFFISLGKPKFDIIGKAKKARSLKEVFPILIKENDKKEKNIGNFFI